MSSQRERVNRYYEATIFDYHSVWTGRYDLAVHFGYYDDDARSHWKALLKMNRVLATAVNIAPGDVVLDAGCGYGGSAIWLAENIGCKVTGINVVPFQIDAARKHASDRKISRRISFIVGDYAAMPFPDASFDIVWALESVVHAEDKAKFLKEASRVLKPGGRLVLAEYMLREPPLSIDEQAELAPWLEGWAMPSLLRPSEYEQFARLAGLSEIVFKDVTEHVRPSFRRLKRLLRFGLPIGHIFAKLGIFSKTHLGNITGSSAQIATLEKGYWRYMIFCAKK